MRLKYALAAVVAVLLMTVTRLSAADGPNVLFLFVDDMRADTIAPHDNPHIRTPDLDGPDH